MPAGTGGLWCLRPTPPAAACGPTQRYARSHSAPRLRTRRRSVNTSLSLSFSFFLRYFSSAWCTKLICYCFVMHVKVFKRMNQIVSQLQFHLCAAKWSSAASSFCHNLPTLTVSCCSFLLFIQSCGGRRHLRMRCLWHL